MGLRQGVRSGLQVGVGVEGQSSREGLWLLINTAPVAEISKVTVIPEILQTR